MPQVMVRWSCSVPIESRMPEVQQRRRLDIWQMVAYRSRLVSGLLLLHVLETADRKRETGMDKQKSGLKKEYLAFLMCLD